MIEDIERDVFVRIRTDLLVVGDSIITDRHHASNGNYEDDDPQNQIGGIIPAFSLSGWLRHGMEKVVQERGSTACHPGESNANFRKDDVYNRDLDDPSARLGSCPWRSWASAWNRLTVHPLKTDQDKYDMTLDANLRRIQSWSTALQYLEDFENWKPDR